MYTHYNFDKGEDMLVLDMKDLKNIAIAFKTVFTEFYKSGKRFVTTDERQRFIKHIIDHATFNKCDEGMEWFYILSTHINIDDESRNNLPSFFCPISFRYNKCMFRNIHIYDIETVDLDDEVGIIMGTSFHDCYFDHVIFDTCRLRSLAFFDTYFKRISFLDTSLRDCIFSGCEFENYLFHDCNIVDGSDLSSIIPLACSIYVLDFKYKVGEYVEPLGTFDEDRFDECSEGIHFFIDKQDAINY